MATTDRRAREQSARRTLILETARHLAEDEGWDAVTTRKLADRVEYSQPVLYSHFANKGAIIAAVAVVGFGELAAELAAARTTTNSPRKALLALAEAYLDFVDDHPALTEAMFVRPIGVTFGRSEETPPELRAAFDEIVTVLEPLNQGRDIGTVAEVFWSALHGLAILGHGGRLRPDQGQQRLDQLVARFS